MAKDIDKIKAIKYLAKFQTAKPTVDFISTFIVSPLYI